MRRRATVIYLISNACSLMGNAIAGVVLPLVLLARTGDVLAAGSLALICAVPQFLAGFVGGAVLDRFDRRRVGIAADLVSALSVALLPVVDAVWGLSFGWFVALGLLGAVGDVPGMTARDTIMPAACRYDGVELQRFVGVDQGVNAAAAIAGPAAAALLMGLVGDVGALWATAACSCVAALATMALPREVGAVDSRGEGEATRPGALSLFTEGMRTLFARDRLVRSSIVLSFGVTMVMGSFQGIVLPAHFTAAGYPEQAGYVVAAMGAGLLVGSLVYSAAAKKLSQYAWLCVSLVGMAAGIAGMGMLPGLPLLIACAALTGFAAGPASALLGFFIYDRIPENRRGAGMGALNALYLVVGPVGVFAGSALIEAMGLGATGISLAVVWAAVCALSLCARSFRSLR
ncbi:MAG: MFS transporter [Coriobacteriia bacterium]|nr:MFS transporter [Coriobacteriia bacterium]MBS5477937.1 MFS transporter [Coriobacteriia bacterium]